MIFIEQVYLENIKSYREARVQFQEGVNFICGANGAGKTTIVEAIGYALFDAAPAKPIKGFIKHGARKGTVRVTFRGADNNRYRSERIVFDKGGGHWRIYDAERGDPLDMNNQEEILQFFQEGAMPIRGGKLDDLFQTMIGVPQGMICAPFLETPAKRKQAFDSILQVDGYKKAFQKTSGVESHFKNRQTELGERREIYERQAEGYDEAKAHIQELETAQVELEKREAKEEAKRKEAQADQQRMEKREREINAALNKQTEAAGALEVKKTAAQNLASEVKKAAEAERVCADNAEEYDAHRSAQRQLNSLAQQQKERDAVQRDLNQKERGQAELEARIQTMNENANQNETQLKEKLESVQEQIEENAPEKRKVESAVADASDQRRLWEDVFKKSDALTAPLTDLRSLLQAGKSAAAAVQKAVEERESQLESLGKYEEVKALAETYGSVEKRRDELRGQVSILNAQAEEAKRRQEEAKDGLCPILRERCQNVGGGDLSLRIASDLVQIQEKAQAPQAELDAAEQELQKASEAKEELNRLDRIRDGVKNFDNAISERRNEVEASRGGIDWESWKNAALSLEMELRELNPEIAEGLLRFVRHLESVEKAPIDSLDAWTEQVAEALGRVEKSIAGVNETVERYVQKAENEQTKGKMELQRYSDKHANLEQEKSGIDAELENIKQTRAQLSADSERLSEMKAAVEGLKTTLEKYEGVDAQTQEARKTRDETSGGYQQYLQNEKTAKGIDEARAKLETARRSEQAAEAGACRR